MSDEIIKSLSDPITPNETEINKDLLLISLLEYIVTMNKNNNNNTSLFNAVCEYLYSKKIIDNKKLYSNKYSDIRNEYISKITSLVGDMNGHVDEKVLRTITYDDHTIPFYQSRYKNDFVELEKINNGGFGSVHKATNKLDGIIYAIKKIPIRNAQIFNTIKTINEVRILAKLNHDNVIRYYSTWIESTNDVEIYKDVYDSESSSDSSSYSNTTLENQMTEYKNNDSLEEFTVLYIQMELCKTNLKDYIFENIIPNKTNNEVNKIMLQILNGVNYIHFQNILHLDLNLKNILIDFNGVVKITDFGLSIEIDSIDQHYDFSNCGTKTYMAPELFNNGKISTKTDIYSAGIIYYELLSNFKTDMERNRMISKLKDGKIENNIGNNTKELNIILKMIKSDALLRPCINEIISYINNIFLC